MLEEREVRLEAEEVLADGLEMRAAALQLLRHRVDVAEAALEGAALEDRGGAGGVIGGVRDLTASWIACVAASRIAMR